jgi:hypothetical protein
MCRNIRILFNFDPPATQDEIRAAAAQYVRKVSGFSKISAENHQAIDAAVEEIAKSTSALLKSLRTAAAPKNREAEAAKAHLRAVKRFGTA